MVRTIGMLIADDASVTQQILTEAAHLSKLPVRLSLTDNGRDCLTLLNGGHIDLAFVDVHMPELSGPEAVWSARKQGIETFVTLMSTPPAPEAVEAAIKLRAYEFLFKPFGMTEALAIMNTYSRITSTSRVLIVDDSSAVRQIVQKIVHASVFNCEIDEAPDGEGALALARISQYDAVFLDSNMPGLGGVATMKRLHLIQPSTKVVMISADESQAVENAAYDGGACAFLHKPFTAGDVDRVLHAAFGLRSPNLKRRITETSFEVAIEGSTIRLAHKSSGHIFEYLWSQRPPYLRNAVVRPARASAEAPTQVAPAAAKAAMSQLRSAHLLAA